MKRNIKLKIRANLLFPQGKNNTTVSQLLLAWPYQNKH